MAGPLNDGVRVGVATRPGLIARQGSVEAGRDGQLALEQAEPDALLGRQPGVRLRMT
jgi:hypothetical protein